MLESFGEDTLKRARYHNAPPRDLPAGAPKDALRQEFARRLSKAIQDANINQSELAEKASKFLPEDEQMGRSLVSAYVRGRAIASPSRLTAMCKVLKVEEEWLVPKAMAPSVDRDNPTFNMQALEDGNVWLKLNRPLSMKAALKIMQIVEQDDEENGAPNAT